MVAVSNLINPVLAAWASESSSTQARWHCIVLRRQQARAVVEAKAPTAAALVAVQATPAQWTFADGLARRGVADATMEAGKIEADVGETALAALAGEPRRADTALRQPFLVLGGDAGGTVQATTARATWGAVAAQETRWACAGKLLSAQASSPISAV